MPIIALSRAGGAEPALERLSNAKESNGPLGLRQPDKKPALAAEVKNVLGLDTPIATKRRTKIPRGQDMKCH
jgi:hypothetical protein